MRLGRAGLTSPDRTAKKRFAAHGEAFFVVFCVGHSSNFSPVSFSMAGMRFFP